MMASETVMVASANAYLAARAFVERDPWAATLSGTFLILALVGIIGVLQLRRVIKLIKKLGETRPMADREREREVMKEISYAICSGVEEAVAAGKVTRADARHWYRRLGNIFDLKDLLPKGQATLKEEIRERLAKLKLSRAIIILPGVTPTEKKPTSVTAEADNVVPIKPTKLGSKLTGKVA